VKSRLRWGIRAHQLFVHHSSPRLLGRRPVAPVSANLRTWPTCAERKRSGIKRSTGSPTASAAEHPKIFSAAALNKMMHYSSSMLMIASIAEATSAAKTPLVFVKSFLAPAAITEIAEDSLQSSIRKSPCRNLAWEQGTILARRPTALSISEGKTSPLDYLCHPMLQRRTSNVPRDSGHRRGRRSASYHSDYRFGFRTCCQHRCNSVPHCFHGHAVHGCSCLAPRGFRFDQPERSCRGIPGIPGADKITVRDLLTERSRLPDIKALPRYDDVLQHHRTPASLVAKIEGQPLLFPLGSKFLHEEHSAYNLLALIVEKKTGLPFAAAVERLVFRPMGLTASGIDDDSPIHSTRVAKGYEPEGVYGLKPATSIHWSAKTGNASVYTTASDEARLVDALFRGSDKRVVKALPFM